RRGERGGGLGRESRARAEIQPFRAAHLELEADSPEQLTQRRLERVRLRVARRRDRAHETPRYHVGAPSDLRDRVARRRSKSDCREGEGERGPAGAAQGPPLAG